MKTVIGDISYLAGQLRAVGDGEPRSEIAKAAARSNIPLRLAVLKGVGYSAFMNASAYGLQLWINHDLIGCIKLPDVQVCAQGFDESLSLLASCLFVFVAILLTVAFWDQPARKDDL